MGLRERAVDSTDATEAGNAGVRPARDSRPGVRSAKRRIVEAEQPLRLQPPPSVRSIPQCLQKL